MNQLFHIKLNNIKSKKMYDPIEKKVLNLKNIKIEDILERAKLEDLLDQDRLLSDLERKEKIEKIKINIVISIQNNI